MAAGDHCVLAPCFKLDRAAFTRLRNRFSPGAGIAFTRSQMKHLNYLNMLTKYVSHKYRYSLCTRVHHVVCDDRGAQIWVKLTRSPNQLDIKLGWRVGWIWTNPALQKPPPGRIDYFVVVGHAMNLEIDQLTSCLSRHCSPSSSDFLHCRLRTFYSYGIS